MDFIALYLAARAGRDDARSALPDAPTVPDPPAAETPSTVVVRRVVARGLRRAADRIEPRMA
jgi:hypothetical protein